MGLDVTAYKNIKQVATVLDWDEFLAVCGDIEGGFFVYENHYFPSHAADLTVNGIYTYGDSYHFRAGSYSGYNWWRNELSKLMLGVPAEEVWKHAGEPEWEAKPFYWLIHFSDSNGYLGAAVCKVLANDFATHQHEADAYHSTDDDTHWNSLYAEWRRAFELAVDGCVRFH